MTTSSPGPIPSAIIAASWASVPDDMPIACFDADVLGDRLLERLDLRAEDESLALEELVRRRADLVAEGGVLLLQVEEGDGDGERHRRFHSGRGAYDAPPGSAPTPAPGPSARP